MGYKNVHSQMFDVRPLKKDGGLDLEKIKKINGVLDLLDWGEEEKVWQKFEKPVLTRTKRAVREKSAGFEKKEVVKTAKDILKYPKFRPREMMETSLPSAQEILDILNQVEEIDGRLKRGEMEFYHQPEATEELNGNFEESTAAIEPEMMPVNKLIEQPELKLESESFEELIEPASFGQRESAVSMPEIASEIDCSEVPAGVIYEETFFQPSNLKTSLPASPFFDDFENKIKKNIRAGQHSPFKTWLAEKFGWLKTPRRQRFIFTLTPENHRRKSVAWGFSGGAILILLIISGLALAGRGWTAKNNILSSALQAYQAMLAAKDSASRLDFSGAQISFETAYQHFFQADQELSGMGRVLISILEKLPGGSPVASGSALIEAGENLARAGSSFSKIGEWLSLSKIGELFSGDGQSLTQKINQARQELAAAKKSVATATLAVSKVNVDDLPQDMRQSLADLKEKLPFVNQALSELDVWSQASLNILGYQQAKKYLLIFQNPSEARPTGGFIGTYGTLSVDGGSIKNLFIDGIFNLDGQLYDKIVPPKPIQKISTAWSTHDANWFADFPTSAQKIMSFYEMAGHETVDGVISLTPQIVIDLLALTGPVDLPQYGVSLNKNNFFDTVQYQVEVGYDKIQNQPKKILADFAPKFLDQLWQVWPQYYQEIAQILLDNLREKNILFYFFDQNLEKLFGEQGWAGQVLPTDKDYLSVINANINGYKTDQVINQQIFHESNVQSDGSIIDTVKIVRQHNGNASLAEWYNKVNADYLRVFVPLGSKLILAQGQTREEIKAPVNYQKLGFKEDPDVKKQEQGIYVDENSGTQIFVESGKTVFGNWVYVSPGETVEITYQYQLPFKLNLNADNFSYSLLIQKQAGAKAGQFESNLTLPNVYPIEWQYPQNLLVDDSTIKFLDQLKTDKFYGVVFGRQ